MKKWKLIERYLKLGGAGSGNYGHAGRPGSVGGSVSRSIGMSRITGQDWEKRWHEARGDDFGYGTAPETTTLAGGKAGRFITRKEDTGDGAVRRRAKDEIVKTLAERTGLPYKDVNTVIAQWAQSSNDSDYRSLSMQEAISKEFGVPLSAFQKGQLEQYGKVWNDPVGKDIIQRYAGAEQNFNKAPYVSMYSPAFEGTPRQLYYLQMKTIKEEFVAKGFGASYEDPSKYSSLLSHRADPQGDVRQVVRAMYEHTQLELKSAGITELKLARGTSSIPVDSTTGTPSPYWARGISTVLLDTNSSSSWSSRGSTARSFGDNVVVSTFPASRILGCARTGFGCLNEQEYVVLGSTNDRGLLKRN